MRFCGIVLLDPRPVRERLVHLGDLVLHHELDVHRDLAERPADEAEEAADFGNAVAHRVPGDIGVPSPSSFIRARCVSIAPRSIEASVPQAPPNSPTSTRGRSCASRSR